MQHAARPHQFDDRLIWAFLHTFLQHGLIRSAVDGPHGQWFVQIMADEPVHHLSDTDDAFDFVLDILQIIDDVTAGEQ